MVPCVPAWLVIGSINGAPATDSRSMALATCLPIGRSETHFGPALHRHFEIAILPDNARCPLSVVRKVEPIMRD